MKRIIIAVMLSFLIFISACSGTITGNAVKEDTIKMGFIGPLTGDASNLGNGARQATEMAVEEINAQGGINGKKLEVIYENTQCKGKDSINAVNKLINLDGVQAIVGGLCSAATVPASELAEENEVVLFSYCASAPKISQLGDYMFRSYPSDAYQGVFMAEYVFDELNAKTAAVFHVRDDWGTGLRDTFTKRFKELGGEILFDGSYEPSSKDMRTELLKIKSSNPDIIYMPSFPNSAAIMLQQADELDIDRHKMLGGDGSYDPEVIKVAGTATEGFRLTAVFVDPKKEVADKYKEKYGHDFILCGVQAYDNTYILADIIGKVGNDGALIKDALYDIDHDGVSGRVRLDSNGDLVGAEYAIYEVQDGEFVQIK